MKMYYNVIRVICGEYGSIVYAIYFTKVIFIFQQTLKLSLE